MTWTGLSELSDCQTGREASKEQEEAAAERAKGKAGGAVEAAEGAGKEQKELEEQ